jgi:hypothetical protein
MFWLSGESARNRLALPPPAWLDVSTRAGTPPAKQETPPMTTNHHISPALPVGTRVLNTGDGESGTVHAAYARNAAGDWTEYEVVTQYGIEKWQRAGFVLLDEVQAAARDNG